MIRNSLGHLLINTECSAPVTIILTVCDKGGVIVELVDYRLEERVANVVHLHLGNRLAVCVCCCTNLALDFLNSGALLLGHKHLCLALGLHRYNLLVGEHDG